MNMFESREIFFRSVDTCNALYRSGHDLSLYREIIRLHREINDLSILLEKDEFYELIFRTLEAWNMNQRGARLTDIDNFKKSVQSLQKYLLYLYQQPLHLISSLPDTAIICPRNEEQGFNVLKYLKTAFCHLNVMDSTRRIVGVSKALHFILPDLVVPMDGKYSIRFFFGSDKNEKGAENEFEKIFKPFFISSHKLVQRLKLNPQDVDDKLWNTSIPKMIDNAIIGVCKSLTMS